MSESLDRLRAGQPYQADDAGLTLLRARAEALVRDLNATPLDRHGDRLRLLASLFGAVGEAPDVESPLSVRYGQHVTLGSRVVIGPGCHLADAGAITLGDRVHLGAGVRVMAVQKPLDAAQRGARWEQAAPVSIGDDVWVGAGSTIGPGVEIGAGTVVGVGSVVLQSLPAGVYALGNPCRIVRELDAEAPSA